MIILLFTLIHVDGTRNCNTTDIQYDGSSGVLKDVTITWNAFVVSVYPLKLYNMYYHSHGPSILCQSVRQKCIYIVICKLFLYLYIAYNTYTTSLLQLEGPFEDITYNVYLESTSDYSLNQTATLNQTDAMTYTYTFSVPDVIAEYISMVEANIPCASKVKCQPQPICEIYLQL